jgi:hypothetical protein
MAMKNHSRKNFEENENVTMFVGSIDKKKDYRKENHLKFLKRRAELQKIRDE